MTQERPSAPGYLITFEGVEGCGKSTQAGLLAERLSREGARVLLTREPGGPPLAEAIRGLLLDPAYAGMDPLAELYLVLAARSQHVARTVRPALQRGEVVVVDRFADATVAYQAGGRGLARELVESLATPAAGGVAADLTFLLDLPPAEAFQRLASLRPARRPDRLEAEEITFHERVRATYLAVARREPERVVVLDGARRPDVLHEEICREVIARLRKLPTSFGV